MLLLYVVAAVTVPLVSTSTADRFTVYWNVPIHKCYRKYNISLPLDDYHIVYNSKYDFIGDKIALLYEYKVGLFPYYDLSNASHPVNGGLPQKANLSAHLIQLEADIRAKIPSKSFNGVAVLDVEEWRPIFEMNWNKKKVYQKESVRLVRERFPSISLKSAVAIATNEFNNAAKKLLVSSFELARSLRPNALWSIYGFPYCNYDAGKDGRCADGFMHYNDQLRWLYDELTAFAPSIYLSDSKNNTQNHRYIQAILRETNRVIAMSSAPHRPVLPYTKFEYSPYKDYSLFYNKADLCSSLKQSMDLGASGVLVWSTDKNMERKRCELIQTELTQHFGVIADSIRSRSNRCSREQCSLNGRCVMKSLPATCVFAMDSSDYRCECDEGFDGEHCQIRLGKSITNEILPSSRSDPTGTRRDPTGTEPVTSAPSVSPLTTSAASASLKRRVTIPFLRTSLLNPIAPLPTPAEPRPAAFPLPAPIPPPTL